MITTPPPFSYIILNKILSRFAARCYLCSPGIIRYHANHILENANTMQKILATIDMGGFLYE